MGAQRAAVETACAQRGLTLIDFHHDVASGKSTNGRHGLYEAFEALKTGLADALVVPRLDRLARSVVDGGAIIRRCAEESWTLVIADLGLDTSTPMGRFGAHILLAAGELESGMISERTKAARAQALREGKPVGGRKRGSYDIPAWTRSLICEGRADGLSYRDICAALTDLKLRPPRGQRWHIETVRKVVMA